MGNWFEVKVRYDKQLENGLIKKVTENYVFDALSWTEAESRAIEELKGWISGEFGIADISRRNFSEVFFDAEGDQYFKAKVQFIMLDEKSGTEKKKGVIMIAKAIDIDKAQELIKERMKGTLATYEIAEVKETKIVEIFAC